LKGNAFATLHVENLSNIATDVSLKLGSSSVEMDFIVKNLVQEDAKKIENFVVENPEMKLPINSDIEEAMLSQPLDGEGVQNSVIEGSVMLGQTDRGNGDGMSLTPMNGKDDNQSDTPGKSDIKSDTSPPWSEVVRRGRNRCISEKMV
jgi:hypothetical protein